MKRFTLLAFLTFSGFMAAQAYNITVKIKGGANEVYLLGYYYGDKQYIRDSVKADATGKVIFKGKEPLEGGVYILASQDKRLLFDFVVTEQEFSMETDTADYIDHMKIKGSPENDAFFTYSRFATKQGKLGAEIDKKFKEAKQKNDTAAVRRYREQLKKLEDEIIAYRENVIKTTPTLLVAKIFLMMKEVDIPDAPILPDGSKDSNFAYYYYRDHYFDHFDFSDDRIVRTPIFHPKLENYITKVTVQIPDTIIKAADMVIGKSLKSKENSKWCIYWITNYYETSQYMGMDAVFVHLVDKYYSDKVYTYWVDETLRFKINDRANTLRNTLIGTKAHNLILPDSGMSYQPLYGVKAQYTVVVFWDPHCGRCKEELPKFVDLYKELNKNNVKSEKKLEIYGVGSTSDYPEWRKYIKEKKLPWINVHDPKHESNYHRFYDINSTPVIYLLNRDKKIIAKRLTVEQIKEFIEKGIE